MAIIFGHFQFCFEAKTQALLKMKIPLMPKLCWRLCQMNECDEYDAEDCGGRNSLSIVKVCTASTALQILTPPFCGGGSSVVTLQKTDIILSAILHTRLRCGWRLTEDKQTADSMRTFCQSRIHPLKGRIHRLKEALKVWEWRLNGEDQCPLDHTEFSLNSTQMSNVPRQQVEGDFKTIWISTVGHAHFIGKWILKRREEREA